MKKSNAKVDTTEIKQIDFDGTKLCNIRTDEVGDPEEPWFLVEPGSDEHIAILEQIVEGAQTRLAEIRKQREASKQ